MTLCMETFARNNSFEVLIFHDKVNKFKLIT